MPWPVCPRVLTSELSRYSALFSLLPGRRQKCPWLKVDCCHSGCSCRSSRRRSSSPISALYTGGRHSMTVVCSCVCVCVYWQPWHLPADNAASNAKLLIRRLAYSLCGVQLPPANGLLCLLSARTFWRREVRDAENLPVRSRLETLFEKVQKSRETLAVWRPLMRQLNRELLVEPAEACFLTTK